MRVRNKGILKKIILPVMSIVLCFALFSFGINYFVTDKFVKANAKEKIDEAYGYVIKGESINNTHGTMLYIYDDDFNEISEDKGLDDSETNIKTFISSLLSNFELDEDVLTNIKFDDKEYIVKLYVSPDITSRARYYILLQDLTLRADFLKDSFSNLLMLQILVLFIVGIVVYKLQERNEEEAKKQKNVYENVAHDLRTPLVSILGYADGLKSGVIKDKDKACNVIIKTGNQLKEMIENILILGRFDDETYKLNMENVDIVELVNEQIEILKFVDNNKDIVLENNLGDVSLLKTDKKLIIRIVQNLLSNAIKYAENKIVVAIRNNKNKCIIEVIDDGVGIEEDSVRHIFDRYYKGKDGHFGIGLSVVKSAASYLKGQVTVEKVEPHGTKFIITV